MDMTLPSAARQLAEEAAHQATERARRVMDGGREMAKQWYVVHNAAGNDKRALDTLKRSDFEVYYPSEAIKKLVPRDRLSQKQRRSLIPFYTRVLKPLFARYFFVRFDLGRGDWHDIFKFAGIHGVLFTEDAPHALPAPVAETEIERFKSYEVDGAIPTEVVRELLMRKRSQQAQPFHIGEEVRIKEGAFSGHTATVETLPPSDEPLDESSKLELLIPMFGRKVPFEIALTDIEKL
jgi:transcription antitermination factor NusG